ncbi:MAG: hypothetical protein JWO09_3402 [Bacteroidetes bacterium]|nr:hypothetical protein [Bacteroidota bacterium]
MKNITPVSTLKRSSFLIIPLLLFFLLGSGLQARNRPLAYVGIRGAASVSANGFGTILCPSLFYKRGNSTIAFGVAFQKHSFSSSGFQLNYEYTLLDRNAGCYIDWLELYSFANLTYYHRATLGKAVCEEEQRSNSELSVDLSQVRLKSLDAYAGFGVRIVLGKNLKWFNGVALGGYSVFNSPEGLFYNSKGLGLLVRTGLSWQFGRQGRSDF